MAQMPGLPASSRQRRIGGMDRRRGFLFWTLTLSATIGLSAALYGAVHLLPWPEPSELSHPLNVYSRAVYTTVILLAVSGITLAAGVILSVTRAFNRRDKY